MNPIWARGLRDQCEAYGVPFLFEQWGNWLPADGSVNGRQLRQVAGIAGVPIQMINMGKKAAGRLLDGREWDELPAAA